MPDPLLLTKLYLPPARANRVIRTRLVHRLEEGLRQNHHLTLVSAPAGFGKTTCISEWVNTLSIPVTWLALDSADDDPGHFFTYFIAALQKVDARIGQEVEGALHSGEVPSLNILSAVLSNDILRVPTRFILVLDDFHAIQSHFILDFIDRLLTNQPEPLHLVMITREDPPLPLARLRARNQITEIRAADLRFTHRETDSFLNDMMGLALSAEDIETLDQRTEGWAAGLQLVGLSIRGQDNPTNFIAHINGNHRYILSYLTEEVLDHLPEDTQTFLLQTSILEKLCGELCDAVCEQNDSASVLEKLYNANLFLIPLDDEQHWYRYHHLFADLLQNRQGRTQKYQTAELHLRASRWYEKAGMTDEAISHALTAKEYGTAVRLLEAHAMRLITQGYVQRVDRWVQEIPAEWQIQSPRTHLAFGWMNLLKGNYPGILSSLERAANAINLLESHSSEQMALRAEWLALRSGLLNVQGKPAESIVCGEEALALTAPDNPYLLGMIYIGLGGAYRQLDDYPHTVAMYQAAIRCSRGSGNAVSEMLAISNLAMIAMQHGKLHLAAQVSAEGLEHHQGTASPPPIAAAVYGVYGLTRYEWNDLEQARDSFLRGNQLAELGGHNAAMTYSRTILSRLLAAEGDWEGAARQIQDASDLARLGTPLWIHSEVISQHTRILIHAGELSRAEDVLNQAGFSIQPLTGPLTPAKGLVYAAGMRWMLARMKAGNPVHEQEELLTWADRVIDEARTIGLAVVALQMLLLRAQMLDWMGKTAPALDDIETALIIAEPEGYLRTFIDEGEPVGHLINAFLINEHGSQGVRDYALRLAACFPAVEVLPDAAPGPVFEIEMVEPLSEREKEVLALLAEGLKYEEIASRLVVTLNTVRFYVKEIYSKLNVNNRTRAVETARRLNLM